MPPAAALRPRPGRSPPIRPRSLASRSLRIRQGMPTVTSIPEKATPDSMSWVMARMKIPFDARVVRFIAYGWRAGLSCPPHGGQRRRARRGALRGSTWQHDGVFQSISFFLRCFSPVVTRWPLRSTRMCADQRPTALVRVKLRRAHLQLRPPHRPLAGRPAPVRTRQQSGSTQVAACIHRSRRAVPAAGAAYPPAAS
jgi:hypothetical protein